MRDFLAQLTFSWFLVAIECLLLFAGVVLIWRSRENPTKHNRLERWLCIFARKKSAACVSIGVLVLVVRATLIPVIGIPQPRWDDEYSYILSGQTFAMGRLTNPTHPMWKYFETFHEIQRPTYSSMYPPAQGLFLASGIILAKNPWIGVLLANALMCAAACWMLQGWLPPGWALYGAFLLAMRLSILSYWMNSYFAGAVPSLGGALVLGALPRILRKVRLIDSLLLAAGLAVLANSRPYEGMVLSIPVAVMLLFQLFRHGRSVSLSLMRVVLPLILVLGLCGAGMMYFFYRVTGNPFEMPYQANRATYAVAPYFIWQKLRPDPPIGNPQMRDYVRWERTDFAETQTLPRLAKRTLRRKLPNIWAFYLGPILSVPLLWGGLAFRDRRMRLPLWIAAAVIAGSIVETWTFAHYLAPAASLLFLLLVQCIRHMHLCSWRGFPLGRQLVRAIPALCLALFAVRVVAAAGHLPIEPPWPRGNLERSAIIGELKSIPGDHLVIVNDSPHWTGNDWIFNGPDIDHEKIVWARDMGEGADHELLNYFHDRQVWWLDPDHKPIQLSPYRTGSGMTTRGSGTSQ